FLAPWWPLRERPTVRIRATAGQRCYPRVSALRPRVCPRVTHRCGQAVDKSSGRGLAGAPLRPSEGLSAAEGEHLDLGQPFRRRRPPLRVAIVPPGPDAGDEPRQLVVGDAAAQRGAQVVSDGAEQARVQLALGGQPRPRAAAAERLGDRGDDADLAPSVDVSPALGDLASIAGVKWLERPLARDRLDDL